MCKTEYGNWWDRLHSTVRERGEGGRGGGGGGEEGEREREKEGERGEGVRMLQSFLQDFCLVPKSESGLHSLHILNC